MNLESVCKKWSHYALSRALSMNMMGTMNRHYAGRSLQIYRALEIKLKSFSSLVNLNQRLRDTAADSNEDVQGYVTELMMTLKMNACLFADAYLEAQAASSKGGSTSYAAAKAEEMKQKEAVKHKSKSLQMQKQIKQQLKQDNVSD